ncbi:MAG: hypothetical protein V1909_02645, partial [Candidatus Micrarchaeota archaeon]
MTEADGRFHAGRRLRDGTYKTVEDYGGGLVKIGTDAGAGLIQLAGNMVIGGFKRVLFWGGCAVAAVALFNFALKDSNGNLDLGGGLKMDAQARKEHAAKAGRKTGKVTKGAYEGTKGAIGGFIEGFKNPESVPSDSAANDGYGSEPPARNSRYRESNGQNAGYQNQAPQKTKQNDDNIVYVPPQDIERGYGNYERQASSATISNDPGIPARNGATTYGQNSGSNEFFRPAVAVTVSSLIPQDPYSVKESKEGPKGKQSYMTADPSKELAELVKDKKKGGFFKPKPRFTNPVVPRQQR